MGVWVGAGRRSKGAGKRSKGAGKRSKGAGKRSTAMKRCAHFVADAGFRRMVQAQVGTSHE